MMEGSRSESDVESAEKFFDQLYTTTYKTGSNEKVVEFYNKGSDVYEKHLCALDYDGPKETAASAAELFPDNRDKIRVLDVAAGTGMVAAELAKLGFKNIDALDPSEKMLEKAKKTGFYGRCINDYVGSNRLDIESDTYDLIMICAGLGAIMTGDYIAGMKELIRVTKPGGYFVMATLQEHFSFDGEPPAKVESEFSKLEKSGLWKLISKRKIAYSKGLLGAVPVYRKN